MTDLRQAWRNLWRTPWFSALVIGVLTLGIGGSTAVFSVLNATLLRPLPYAEPARLVRIWSGDPARHITRGTLSYPRFERLRAQTGIFAGCAANFAARHTLAGDGDPEQVSGEQVSADFFSLLGVRLQHGRGFVSAEDAPGGEPVVVLAHALWQRRFGGTPDAVGRKVLVNGTPHTVIGILPADFRFPYSEAEIWLTQPSRPALYDSAQIARGAAYLNLTARLAPGASLAQAREAVAAVERDYRADLPGNVDAHTNLEVITFQEELVGQQRAALFALFAAAAFVHLIACANVASLLLARFTARRRELAMRVALGSGRARLLSLCGLEALLLVAPACLLGLGVAALSTRGLGWLVNHYLPHPVVVRVDLGALAFAVLLSLLTGAALGWLPASQGARRDLLTALRESSQSATAARTTRAFRRTLLVAEVALAFVLLVMAGLLLESFLRLRGTDPGLAPRDVVLAGVELPAAAYPTAQKQSALAAQLLERLRTLPNVSRAALADSPPLDASPVFSPYAAADRPLPPVAERTMAIRRIVSPGYFATVGLPLRRGRDFGSGDLPDGEAVAIVNEAAARQLFGTDDPLGRRVVLGVTTRTAVVVGLVGDTRGESLSTAPKPEIYFNLVQRPRPALTLVLRTSDTPSILAPTLRAILRELDRDLPLINPRWLDDDYAQSLADRRLPLILVGLFGGIALLLALLGIYGVMSYTVALRRPEIATRLVLGATPASARRLILGEGLRLTGLGLLAGLAGACFAAGLLPKLLYGITAAHPPVYLQAALLLGAVAYLACWLSARRATAIDPVLLLREN